MSLNKDVMNRGMNNTIVFNAMIKYASLAIINFTLLMPFVHCSLIERILEKNSLIYALRFVGRRFSSWALIICVFCINTPVLADNSSENFTADTGESNVESNKEETEVEIAWYDKTHSYVSSYSDNPAIWFDQFFANDVNEASFEREPSMRWRLSTINEYNNQTYADLNVKLRVSIDLPKLEAWFEKRFDKHFKQLKQRVQLIINDDKEADESTDENIVNNAFVQEVSDSNLDDGLQGITGALRVLIQTQARNISIDVGARSSYVFVKGQTRNQIQMNEDWQFELKQQLRWRSDDGFDAHLLSNFSRRLTQNLVVNQSNKLYSDEPFNYAYMSHVVSLFQHVSDKTAISYGASSIWAFGEDSSANNASDWYSHGLSMRVRRQLYSNWLFVEVEPYINWKREFDFASNAGLFLRFEAVFAENI